MKPITEPQAGKSDAPIFQLKVVLLWTKPPGWRRLQVDGDAKLDWLHAALQVALGWTNSHLHQFRVGEASYSDTRHHFAEYEGDPEIQESRKFALRQIVSREGDTFDYDYDFGDSWNHEITVEKILPPGASAVAPAICLDGAMACPPEDCGGPPGYDNLLKILKNKRHPEHKHMHAWLGRTFDAKAFNVEKTNLWLGKLKWPRVTEAQLRKTLMARDHSH